MVWGVMVLGMQCEGLDSEYTVTSSSSYLNSSEVKLEYWKCRSFLEFASACTLRLPSVASRVFRMEVMNRFSGMHWNGVYQNDSEYECKGERSGGSEFI